jgi:3'(2'), 5'-bisphosphate nucleotidase
MLTSQDTLPLLDLAKQAGELILRVYQTDFSVHYKDDRSPLTEADTQSDALITEGLKRLHPHIPILSEESQEVPYEDRKNWEYFWLVDPLDGTREFVKKNGAFTINIALVHHTLPVFGLIYAPVFQTAYYAHQDGGSFKVSSEALTPQRLHPKPIPAPPEPLVVLGSRSHPHPEFAAFLAEKEAAYPQVEVLTIGSALKFGWIAEGKADLYPRYGPTMEWDTAAGQIILNEVGKNVLNLETGTILTYNKECLRNPGFMCT